MPTRQIIYYTSNKFISLDLKFKKYIVQINNVVLQTSDVS